MTFDRSRDSRIINNPEKPREKVDPKKISSVGKAMTTNDFGSFISNANSDDGRSIRSLFGEKSYISNILTEHGFLFVKDLPNTVEGLIGINGIGKKSAIKIMEGMKK